MTKKPKGCFCSKLKEVSNLVHATMFWTMMQNKLLSSCLSSMTTISNGFCVSCLKFETFQFLIHVGALMYDKLLSSPRWPQSRRTNCDVGQLLLLRNKPPLLSSSMKKEPK
jgi:hypothetical protein